MSYRVKLAIRLTAATLIGTSTCLAATAYLVLPWPDLRPYSGPPPILSFDADNGSGFFLDTSGHVLTNRHVVRNCRRITIAGPTFRAAEAQLVAVPADPALDLALLQADIPAPATLPFSDEPWPTPPPSGDTVPPDRIAGALQAANGREHGHATMLGYAGANRSQTPDRTPIHVVETATTTDRRHWLRRFDGPVTQGDSGSPVLDDGGAVVGIVTALTAELDPTTRAPNPADLVRTGYGMAGRHGLMIPAAVALAFAQHSGLDLPTGGTQTDRAKAVTRVFCFRTFPFG